MAPATTSPRVENKRNQKEQTNVNEKTQKQLRCLVFISFLFSINMWTHNFYFLLHIYNMVTFFLIVNLFLLFMVHFLWYKIKAKNSANIYYGLLSTQYMRGTKLRISIRLICLLFSSTLSIKYVHFTFDQIETQRS